MFVICRVENFICFQLEFTLMVGSCPNNENGHQILFCPFLCRI